MESKMFNNDKEQMKVLKAVEYYFKEKNKTKQWKGGKDWLHYSGPCFDEKEYIAAIKVLLDEWLILGKEGRKFESKFAKELECKYGIMTNSGSSANLLMLAAYAFGENKWERNTKIITPVSGFATTVAPIIQLGFDPVFIDVELDTMNIDLNKLEERLIFERETLSKHNWSKAIIFAHVLGNPPNMNKLMKIIKKYDLILLEDCCDALGSEYNGKKLGSFGEISTCSFFPAHHMTSGEGGFVATNDENIYNKLRSLRDWGRGCSCAGKSENVSTKGACGKRFSNWLPEMGDLIVDHKYIFDNVGFNLRPTEMQAAMASVQLEKLPKFHSDRKENHEKLKEIFKSYSKYFKVIKATNYADVSWFAFPVIIKEDAPFNRAEFIDYFEKNKIQTRPYFAGNILHQPGYNYLTKKNRNKVENFPNANKILRDAFFLGVSPVITIEQIGYIEEVLDNFIIKNCKSDKEILWK
jgi:CDP-4-dehydro-6-deoxyglucose reductase, E1